MLECSAIVKYQMMLVQSSADKMYKVMLEYSATDKYQMTSVQSADEMCLMVLLLSEILLYFVALLTATVMRELVEHLYHVKFFVL